MYLQPYGDDQQLNLNWIINEIINLHKQLDPDYETPSFTQVYPYSNLNRLNLDWVLSELKALKELAPEPTPEIDIQAVAEALVALPFDSNTSYQIYDFISRDGEIWRATEAIAAGGVWDETKWFKTKIGTDLAVLERWINAINNSLTSLQNTVANLSSIDISDDSDAGGTTVKASLNNLKSAVDTLENDLDGLTSADISDDSDVGGTTVKASLNNLKSAVDTLENDLDDLNSANNAIESAIAIVADGNAHAAITSGQYVYIKNHATLADGLYQATSTIPLNGAISSTNVTSVSNGGLNSINDLLNIRTGNCTVSSLVETGGCSYYRIGRIVILNFSLNGTFASGDTLATNLPLTPAANNVLYPVSNNNNWSNNPRVRVTNTGELIMVDAVSGASLRGFILYLTTSI